MSEENAATNGNAIKCKLFHNSPSEQSSSPEKRVKLDLQRCRCWTVEDVCDILVEKGYKD